MTDEQAQQAVEALVRGVGVAIAITVVGRTRLALLEDLHEMGAVLNDVEPLELLTPDQQQALRLLASGVSMADAATQLGWSRRTFSRRLAEVRTALGVTSTVEALALIADL